MSTPVSRPLHPIASAVLITWKRNAGYALRMLEDLTPEQFTAQPVPGRIMNHPAWIACHLTLYPPVCTGLLLRRPFTDPIDHRYGQRSEVSTNPADYPPGRQIIAEYCAAHDQAQEALHSADPAVFAEPNPIERQREKHPSIGDMIVTLMVKHEMGHLGQLSAWRRAMGLPRVAM